MARVSAKIMKLALLSVLWFSTLIVWREMNHTLPTECVKNKLSNTKGMQIKAIITKSLEEDFIPLANSDLSDRTNYQVHTNKRNCQMDASNNYMGKKIILFYNSFFGSQGWEYPLGQETFVKYNCEFKNCYTTHDKNLLKRADAVLFHKYELTKDQKPPYRHPNQRYVFMSIEGPCHGGTEYNNWNDLFNWTMTYKLASDIPWPYGHVIKRNPRLHRDYRPIVEKKTRLAAWMVSNCGSIELSQRMEYVKELQKYVEVDIYGKCGTKICSHYADGVYMKGEHKCLKLLNDTYKFYLSFENSFCPEDITGKFFKILSLDVVPIVRGGGSSAEYTNFLPAKYFLDTRNFASPKALAKRLKFLDANDNEYIKYLRRMDYYWGDLHSYKSYKAHASMHPWCTLCKKLNDPKEPRKWYSRIDLWFNSKLHCLKPPDMKWAQ